MRYISQNAGFTLLEIIVVMAIISIAVAILVPRQMENRGKKILGLEAQKVADDVRSARSYTFNTLDFNGGGPPVGGFGIHFDENSSTYFIFGDEDGSQAYESCNSSIPVCVNEKYQEMVLSDGIKISDVEVAGGETSADVVFTPPYGIVFIDGDNTAGRELEITITGLAGSKTIKVSVDGAID